MNNRILKILTVEGISPSKFSDKIGVTRSSISHILSGRNKPSLDVITKILISFKNINPEWLILGKDPMYKTVIQTSLFENINPLKNDDVDIHDSAKNTIDKPIDVISEETTVEKIVQSKTPEIPDKQVKKVVEKIVTFYTDKTFNEYFPVE